MSGSASGLGLVTSSGPAPGLGSESALTVSSFNAHRPTSIGNGDHFGELSILADIPRQATVRAASVCLLVSISREPFRNLMEQLPAFGNTVQSVMKHYMLSR